MKVRVTRLGYIHNGRVKPGAIIEVTEKEFSSRWMEKIDPSEPTQKVEPKQVEPAKVSSDQEVI